MENMERQSMNMDVENRDPQNNNAFLKVAYSDVICEPSAVHSPQRAHQITKTIYEGTIFGTYSFLTIIFGGLLSVLYGLTCGLVSFFMVWLATPFTRAWFIPLGLMGKVWLFFVKCFYDPYFESCGRIFSNMKIKLNHATIQQV